MGIDVKGKIEIAKYPIFPMIHSCMNFAELSRLQIRQTSGY